MTPEQIENAEAEIRKWFPPLTSGEAPIWRVALDMLVGAARGACRASDSRSSATEAARLRFIVAQALTRLGTITASEGPEAMDALKRLEEMASGAQRWREAAEERQKELSAREDAWLKEASKLGKHISDLEKSLETVRKERDDALRQQRHAWERHADKDRACGEALAQRDAARAHASRLEEVARLANAELERLKPSGQVAEDVAQLRVAVSVLRDCQTWFDLALSGDLTTRPQIEGASAQAGAALERGLALADRIATKAQQAEALQRKQDALVSMLAPYASGEEGNKDVVGRVKRLLEEMERQKQRADAHYGTCIDLERERGGQEHEIARLRKQVADLEAENQRLGMERMALIEDHGMNHAAEKWASGDIFALRGDTLSIRDEFAKAAMQALLTNPHRQGMWQDTAERAYKMAAAMLAERETDPSVCRHGAMLGLAECQQCAPDTHPTR